MTEGKPSKRDMREAPWSLRGVSNETRSAATVAAKLAGLPVGAWVDRALRDAATQDAKASRQQVGPTQEQQFAALVQAIQATNEKLDGIARAQMIQPPRRSWNPFRRG